MFEVTLPLPRSIPAADAGVDLATLVHTHAATLFRVANSLLRNPAEAEDVVQDTFLRVLEHRHKLPAIRDLRPWLIRIAWNLALDRRRRKQPAQADELFLESLLSPGTPADQVLTERREARLALDQIDRLPAAERQVLLLSAIEELEAAEIAATMGKSPSAVRALLFRARTHLRQRLGNRSSR